MLRQLRRNHFGRKSERLSEDQLNLGLEDLETAIASGEAAAEKADATLASVAQSGTQSQPRPPARASAARGDRHRAAEQDMPLLRRRSARHRRGSLRAARQDPGQVPGDRDAAAQVCLPDLRADRRRRDGRHHPGAGAGAADRRRPADRGAGRRRRRLEVRLAPAACIARRR